MGFFKKKDKLLEVAIERLDEIRFKLDAINDRLVLVEAADIDEFFGDDKSDDRSEVQKLRDEIKAAKEKEILLANAGIEVHNENEIMDIDVIIGSI